MPATVNDYTTFDLIDVLRRRYKQLSLVVLAALVLAVTTWMFIPYSYTGVAVLQAELTEDLFKQTSSIFYNPAKAKDYFKKHGASPAVMGMIPKKIGKLNSVISPIYAYNNDRKLASTKPQLATNHVILLHLEMAGSNTKNVEEALQNMGEFVQNSILAYQLDNFTSQEAAKHKQRILKTQNKNLDLQFLEAIAKQKLQNLTQQVSNSKLPQSFTWSIPEKEESHLFLPPQVQLAGAMNTLQSITAQQAQNNWLIAQGKYYVEFFDQLKTTNASPQDAASYLRALSETIKTVFDGKQDDAAQFVKNNLTKVTEEFQAHYDSIYFVSPPHASARPANLKIKAAVTGLLFFAFAFLGFGVTILGDKYSKLNQSRKDSNG